MKIKYAVHHYVDGCYEGVRGIYDNVDEAIEKHKQLSETEAASEFDFTIEVVYDGGEDVEESKVFAAVHVITESFDHYNYLLEVKDCTDLIDQLISNLGDEFAYICDIYVTMPDDFDTNAVEASVMLRSTELQEKMFDDEEGGDD